MVLRPPKIEDAQELHDSLSDDVVKWLALIPRFSVEDARNAISKIENSKNETYTFHIELKENKKMIGVMMINSIDAKKNSGKIVYWINRKYQNKGFATEALKEIIRFCRKDLELCRIEADIFADNEKSIRVVKKLGFHLDRTKEEPVKCLSTGKLHECAVYVLS